MLKQFFIICSGADTDILDQCAIGEQNKFAGIGATVFFTAVMATIAASYALYTVFDNGFVAVGFGIIWGLVIFNLDRFIVSTIKKRNKTINEITQALPRIILAVLIAIVISKPLELKIFEKEINQVLLEQKNELTVANQHQIAGQFDPKINDLERQILGLQNQIEAKEKNVNALYDTYISEAEGTAGTKRLGKGPVYNEKRDKHDTALHEFAQLKSENKAKIKAIEDQIIVLQSDYISKVKASQPIIDHFDGLMARIGALNKLPFLPSLFILLLFLAIETSPILAKLMAPKGEYDYKLEDAETAIKTWVEQKVSQRKVLLKTDQTLNNKIYTAFAEEEDIYKYKEEKTRELMKLQADAFFKRQNNVL